MTLVIIYEHTLFHTLSQLELLKNRLHVETRIKEGAENLLQVLDTETLPDGKELARQVAAELQASKLKISNIHRKLGELQDSMPGEGPHKLAVSSQKLSCSGPSHGLRRSIIGSTSQSKSNRIPGVPFARHLDDHSLFDAPPPKQMGGIDPGSRLPTLFSPFP